MSPSTIIDKELDEIQAAMGIALLRFSTTHGISYSQIGKVIDREKQSVAQYINNGTEMPATCWLKLVAKWPELAERLEFELDDAEKAFRAKQRSLTLPMPSPAERAA
jgi:hypothetical protein